MNINSFDWRVSSLCMSFISFLVGTVSCHFHSTQKKNIISHLHKVTKKESSVRLMKDTQTQKKRSHSAPLEQSGISLLGRGHWVSESLR